MLRTRPTRLQHASRDRKLIACLAPILLALLLVGAAHACPLQARSTEKHASKEEIEALEEQWREAVLKDDVALMDKLLSDDYVGISMTGQVNTKVMQLDRLRSRSLLISRMDLSDVRVKLLGDVAIVTSLAQIDGSNDGQQVHGTFRYTRIYQKLPSGLWKITNFEATRVGSPRPQQRGGPASAAASEKP